MRCRACNYPLPISHDIQLSDPEEDICPRCIDKLNPDELNIYEYQHSHLSEGLTSQTPCPDKTTSRRYYFDFFDNTQT